MYINDEKKHARAMKNAKFVLLRIAEAKPGDNILVIGDAETYELSHMFLECARKLGMNVAMIDLDIYGGEEGYDHLPVMEPVKQAILHADVAFMTTPQVKTNFGMFLGDDVASDKQLLGKSKRFIFEIGGLDEWKLNEEEVMANRTRALNLYSWLKKADEVHVTTKRGTDLRVKVGDAPDGMYPVMGIIPFYSEVAIVPSFNSVNGVVVNDGASERAYNQRLFPIRPNIDGYRELYKEPLRFEYKDSFLVGYSGDPVQTARLDKLLATVDPKPELCDELGLVCTTSVENGIYGWQVDHSHQTNCVHVALGNNHRRGEIIHSTEHIDFDVYDPIIEVDGRIIYQDGVFNDELIASMA